MRNTIKRIDPSYPIVNRNNGVVTDNFRLFLLEVQQRGLLIGSGSPEGIVEAQQGQEYMNDTGSPGTIKYIKFYSDIGGDKSQGWIAIG